jgi:hypothetical protein
MVKFRRHLFSRLRKAPTYGSIENRYFGSFGKLLSYLHGAWLFDWQRKRSIAAS